MPQLPRRSFLALLGALSTLAKPGSKKPSAKAYVPSFLHPNDRWVVLRSDQTDPGGSGWNYQIVDLDSGRLIQTLAHSAEDTYYGTPEAMFDPSGQFVVQVYYGRHDSGLRRWKIRESSPGLDFPQDAGEIPSPMELPAPGGFVRFPEADYDLADFKMLRERDAKTVPPPLDRPASRTVVSRSGKIWALNHDYCSLQAPTGTAPGLEDALSDQPMLWRPSELVSDVCHLILAKRSSRDSILVQSGFCTVREIDASTGKVLRTLSGTMPQTGLVAFGATRGLLFAARPLDRPVLWDRNRVPDPLPEQFDPYLSGIPPGSLPYRKVGPSVPVGRPAPKDPTAPQTRALAVGRQGFVLGTEDGRILLGERRAADGGPWSCLGSHREAVRGLAFAPDQALLLSGSKDGSLKVWDLTGKSFQRELPSHEARVNAVAVAKDGLAASGGPDGIRIWDLKTGALRRHVSSQGVWVSDVALDPGGAWVAGALLDGSVRRWSLKTGALDWHHDGGPGWCAALAYHADTHSLAAGFESGELRLLELDTGKLGKRAWAHRSGGTGAGGNAIHALAWSSDGQALSAAFGDSVRIFDRNLLSGEGHEWVLPLDAEDLYT